MNAQNLERLDPAAILPRKLQWRAYSAEQIGAAARLLERAGDTQIPPLIDEEDRVVFGEEFVLAAQKLELKSITVVRSSSMSPEELRLYAISAQKVFDLGSFDDVVLGEEMQELQSLLGADCLHGLAFEEGELTSLLGLDGDVTEELEASVALEATAITGLGDLWEVGKHRFLCGSSLEASSFEVLMQGDKASFGFTDMPYNLAMSDISSDASRDETELLSQSFEPDQPTDAAGDVTTIRQIGSAGAVNRDTVLANLLTRDFSEAAPVAWPTRDFPGNSYYLTQGQAAVIDAAIERANCVLEYPPWTPFVETLVREFGKVSEETSRPAIDEGPDTGIPSIVALRGFVKLEWNPAALGTSVLPIEYSVYLKRTAEFDDPKKGAMKVTEETPV